MNIHTRPERAEILRRFLLLPEETPLKSPFPTRFQDKIVLGTVLKKSSRTDAILLLKTVAYNAIPRPYFRPYFRKKSLITATTR